MLCSGHCFGIYANCLKIFSSVQFNFQFRLIVLFTWKSFFFHFRSVRSFSPRPQNVIKISLALTFLNLNIFISTICSALLFSFHSNSHHFLPAILHLLHSNNYVHNKFPIELFKYKVYLKLFSFSPFLFVSFFVLLVLCYLCSSVASKEGLSYFLILIS